MGLPETIITFKQLASTAILRSETGIVALILKDTLAGPLYAYNNFDQVTESWSDKNKNFIQMVFKSSPKKVYVAVVGTTKPTLTEALGTLGNNKWNYLSYPEAETSDLTTITTWIKTKRNTDYKTYKFIGGKLTSPDDKGIINLTTEEIKTDDKPTGYTPGEFTARIVGIAASVGLTSSLTNYALPEIQSIKELADDSARSTAIDNGQLIIYNNGDDFVIARGVTSATTINATDIFRKIRIVEIIDIIRDDLTSTINKNYKGKVLNTYNNKLLLVGSINSYFATLSAEGALDPNYNNRCEIDYNKQRKWLATQGVKVDEMSESEILSYPTKDQIFLQCHVKTVDVMEDFNIDIYV